MLHCVDLELATRGGLLYRDHSPPLVHCVDLELATMGGLLDRDLLPPLVHCVDLGPATQGSQLHRDHLHLAWLVLCPWKGQWAVLLMDWAIHLGRLASFGWNGLLANLGMARGNLAISGMVIHRIAPRQLADVRLATMELAIRRLTKASGGINTLW
jgi:hypothetical protein